MSYRVIFEHDDQAMANVVASTIANLANNDPNFVKALTENMLNVPVPYGDKTIQTTVGLNPDEEDRIDIHTVSLLGWMPIPPDLPPQTLWFCGQHWHEMTLDFVEAVEKAIGDSHTSLPRITDAGQAAMSGLEVAQTDKELWTPNGSS